MTNTTDEFLDAEQAAHELMEDLRKLRDLTTGYTGATTSLQQSRDEIATLIAAFQEVAARLKSSVSESIRAGLPEVVKRLESIEPLITTKTQLTIEALSGISRSIESFAQQTHGVSGVLADIDASARKGFEDVETALSQLRAYMESIEAGARKRSRLLLGLATLGLVLLLVSILLQLPGIRAAFGG